MADKHFLAPIKRPAEPPMVAAAHALVPALSTDGFRSGRAGHIEVVGAGEMTLPPVSCYGIPPNTIEIQRPLNMPPQEPGFLTKVHYPRHVISRLDDAICLPGGVALADGHTVLQESFSAPWEADYHNALVKGDTGWSFRQDFESISTFDEPTLFADYQHNAFFGHFLADSLSRFWAVDFCRVWLGTNIRNVLITEPVPPFISLMLQAIGIAVVPLRSNHAVLCRELIVATKGFQIQEYISPMAVSFWPRLRALMAVHGSWPKKIFISRRHNPTRKLVEEEQIEALFVRHGFTIFCPETVDITTQVSVFSAARMIAGCSGSNMFNIAFQQNAVSILILISPLLVHYSEHFLSAGGNARLSYFPGYVTEEQMELTPGYVHAPWHIDPKEFESYLADWVASGSR